MPDDASGGEDETMTYRTPFGTEVDMRQSHLAALPGKGYSEWLDSLNRASQVFGGNSLELERHLTRFVATPTHVNDLPEGFDVEANRLLHNYLASLATLRDVQRMVHHKLWPERHAPESETTNALSGRSRSGSRSAFRCSATTRSRSWLICGTSRCTTRSRQSVRAPDCIGRMAVR